ncbi:MAG: NAD-dependent epimerase/dehydratase family protein [Gemmatimonadales bacterium]
MTGAGGFIGRRVVGLLARDAWKDVACLVRDPSSLAGIIPAGWQGVTGDLASPASYREALPGVDTVVHLAAATGNALAAEMDRVNVEGTRDLLAECRAAGVARFIFVSSIAARYRDLRHYPYGRSKAEAEALVRDAGLEFVILRPTIVLGAGSPIWLRLRQLANAPVSLMIGDGRPRVQPVAVDDVARAILILANRTRLPGNVLELGGPEPLSLDDLLRRIRAASGRRPAPILHLPARPMQLLLAGLGRLIPRLPVSPGQLAPFLNDGTAAPGDLAELPRSGLTSLDDLLARLART